MKFSVMFWNVWLDNQIDGLERANNLLSQLTDFISEHQPDVLGLCEVFQRTDGSSDVLDAVRDLGYSHIQFTENSPYTDELHIGSALCSKQPLTDVQTAKIGRDNPGERRGYKGYAVKATSAVLQSGATIVLVHPAHLALWGIPEHYRHIKAIAKLMSKPQYSSNTLLIGDFNEPRFFPFSFARKTAHLLHQKTGSFKNPTWQHVGSNKTPLRANLDKVFWTKKGTLVLETFSVLHPSVSDHKPLLATFSIDTV